MESEISYNEYKPFNLNQNNAGLLRFRSAPSSFLASWDGNSQFSPQYPRTSGSTRPTSMNGSYRAQNLDLMRQISTPTELFSPLSAQNGYGFSNGQVEFSSPMPTTLGMLSRISEVENDKIEINATHGYKDPPFYGSGLPFADNFIGFKTEMDCNDDIQGEGGSRNLPHMLLSHHLQDTVPCKLRAKRGCATHPRSIAERVRRTRISERMRKLQELVPNMEKQTNTSDMLDLAVDYIKKLQKQYKSLSDIRAKCKCSAMQKLVLDQKKY